MGFKRLFLIIKTGIALGVWPGLLILALGFKDLVLPIFCAGQFGSVLLFFWINSSWRSQSDAHLIEPFHPFAKSVQRILDQYSVQSNYQVEIWTWPEPSAQELIRFEGRKALWCFSRGALRKYSEEQVERAFRTFSQTLSNSKEVEKIKYTQWVKGLNRRLDYLKGAPDSFRYWILTFGLLPLYIKEHETV